MCDELEVSHAVILDSNLQHSVVYQTVKVVEMKTIPAFLVPSQSYTKGVQAILWLLFAMIMASGLNIAATRMVQAAELSDVTIPDTWQVNGQALLLNGIGAREYGLFGTDVYVAGLYLPEKQTNAMQILNATTDKVLHMQYRYGGGSADDAREAWVEYFQDNCKALQCAYPQAAVDQFLAIQRPVLEGDIETYTFTADTVIVTVNQQKKVRIQDATFARLLLACWIGPRPSTDDLKAQLLGLK